MDKYYYKECFLEDIYHFDALEVWDKLEIGKSVKLYLKEDGEYSKNIKVELDENGPENKLLGVLSEEDSKSMLLFFKSGWNELFLGKIGLFDKENQKIKIVVYIKLKSDGQGQPGDNQ